LSRYLNKIESVGLRKA